MLKKINLICVIIFATTLCLITNAKASDSKSLESNAVVQQGNTLKGTVTDAAGPLIGASVSIKGTSAGTVTNPDGEFILDNVRNGTIIVVSYIGYVTQEISYTGQSQISVILQEDAAILDEVVVVGYGVQKRAHLTGSVSQVSAKELTKAPMQNVSNLLTAKVPGLTAIQRQGKPGDDGTKMQVRGMNSWLGSNAPMVIVDGVPRQIDFVNPNDVESVSVLKDASSSIYGVFGASGVILITTKSGGDGPAKISYDGSYTLTQNTAMPEYLNARDYMYWHNKARQMDGLTPLWTSDIQNKVMNNDPNSIWGETDWIDKVFRTGTTQQHNISASGGNEKSRYYTSIGVMDQEGTLRNTSYTRYNIRGNIDILVAKNLRFSTNLAGMRSNRNWPGYDISRFAEFNPIGMATNTLPIIKSEFNGYPAAWTRGVYAINPYAALYNSGFIRQNTWRFDSNYKLEYDFSGLTNVLKGLKASVFAAYNYSNTGDSGYLKYYEMYRVNEQLDEGIVGAPGISKEGSYTKSASWGDDWMLRPQIDYSREFGKHYVAATLLYEAQSGYSNTMTGTARGYFIDDPDISLGMSFPENPLSGSHKYYGGRASYIGKFNYVFDRKYLAEFAFRYDGSYLFATESRWGLFPAASLGWMVSQENFFANTFPKVNYLKLRASYGQAGMDNDVSPFTYNSQFATKESNSDRFPKMTFGGAAITQFYTSNAYIYRNLTWSTTDSYNLGIDYGMWNGKLGVELDLFYKYTRNIQEKQEGAYPPSLGGYYPNLQNTGEVDNKGIELTLKHENSINRDWQYSLKGYVAYARNRVLKKKLADDHPSYRAVLGQPINSRRGFNVLGFFQSQEEIDNYPAPPSGNLRPGDLKYEDVNGDGIISQDYDYRRIGYGDIPEINFSMDMNLSWKGFYMSLLWQGVTHTDYALSGYWEDRGYPASTIYTSPFSGNSPYYLIEGAWTPENTNAKFPRLSTAGSANNAWESSWWIINGEYLRLKNMNIGYNVPASALKKTPFSSVNIYLAGTNLLTFSHFKWVDPESPSISTGYYPQQKTYSLGLKVTF
ncbi:MAG: TonB-dependent receptor [Dysgonamonadaceae bacterium]|jgi:TonB-linked SusC/RagA family outer membrane protein|nr:TonB-dependent receptor [Dysgonamonadaceae bacterium]